MYSMNYIGDNLKLQNISESNTQEPKNKIGVYVKWFVISFPR